MPAIRMMPAAKISASCQVSSPPFPVVLPSVVAGPELTVWFGVGGAPRVGACCAPAGPASARTSASTAIDHPTRARIAAECSPPRRRHVGAGPRGTLTDAMPPKPRQIKVEQRSALAAMQQLETRSDEELEREQKFKAAAQAILGARAAERYDADAARAHFRRAIAAARPQPPAPPPAARPPPRPRGSACGGAAGPPRPPRPPGPPGTPKGGPSGPWAGPPRPPASS